MKRFVALLLALTMLLSLVSCGKKTSVVDIVEDDAAQKVEETIVDKTDDAVEIAPVVAETDRETLEKIADMVGIDDKEDVSSMDDDTLEDYIYSELDKEVADLTPSKDATTGDNPAVDSTGKEEYYEEDGSMNQPFDVIYPELVANGEVEYAGDAVDKKDIIPVGTVIRVTVVGNGTSYTGEASTTYRIVPQSLAKATVKVANQQYTGKPIVPSKEDITVTVNKVKVDPENFEIVSCTNNVNKGSATLTIRGVGENYGGVKTVKFKIDAKTMFWLFW